MKNKKLKAILATALIITLTIADFMILGMNLITYAMESVSNVTAIDNVKFAAFFKEGENITSQTQYEMTNTEMKLYLKVSVENEGYFEGKISLGDSNFKFKEQEIPESIGKINGDTITLNRIRTGNIVEIEVEIEPIITESYSEEMLSKESIVILDGNYTDSSEKVEKLNEKKYVTLNLSVPSNIDTMLEAKVITSNIYKIGEENKKLVQIEINSKVLKNEYPIKATDIQLVLPEGVEQAEVITKGTYATNGKAEQKLTAGEGYVWNIVENTLQIVILNNDQGKNISWKKEAIDSMVVTLILPENSKFSKEEYKITSKITLVGSEGKSITKDISYNLALVADGIIRANIQNTEEFYKGKLYSGEEKQYNTTTNIEVNYAGLIEKSNIKESTIYKTEDTTKDTNIEYRTTTLNILQAKEVLGENGKLTIKDENGINILDLGEVNEVDANGNLTIKYQEGIKQIQIEIKNPENTGIIKLTHTKEIKAEEHIREEIKALKNLVEKVDVTYNVTKNSFEISKELKDTTSEATLTVTPQIISADKNNQMQMAITLKTDKESYELYNNPTFTLTMPEGITINSVSNGTISASDGGLSISKLEQNGTSKIIIEISGKQQKYVTSEINTQIIFTANVTLEKLMPNKIDTIKIKYTNQGETFETESAKINLIASNEKIVTNLKIDNYNGAGQSVQKYSYNTNSVKDKLPLDSNQEIEAPITYTIINNYDAAISLAGIVIARFTDKDGNEQELVNYGEPNITIEAGGIKVINQTLRIPAGLYYGEKVAVETLAEYTYLGTKNTINNNIELVTEEKEGIRESSTIDNKLQIETFTQLGDSSGISESDEIYNEQVISYIIEVKNISSTTITNVKLKNIQENGNIFDLKEVWVTDRVNEFAEHQYGELDTNEKTFEIEAIEPGETKEVLCRVVVKKSQENDITTANISITANGIQEQNVQTISNKVKDAELKITTRKATNEEVDVIGTDIMPIRTTIKNLTNQKLKNIRVKKYMTEDFEYEENYSITAYNSEDANMNIIKNVLYNEEEQCIEFTITEIEENKEITIMSTLDTKSVPLDQFSSVGIIYLTANDVISNNIMTNIKQAETELSVVQTINIAEDQKVKRGEEIIIVGEVTNKGYIKTQVRIEDELPNGLEITKVEFIKNNVVTDETKSVSGQFVTIIENLEPGEKGTIKIYTKVNTSLIATEEISNEISAFPTIGKTAYSNVVIIQIDLPKSEDDSQIPEEPTPEEPGNKDPEEPENPNPDPENPDPENPTPGGEDEKPKDPTYIISGYVWLDKNDNATKDDGEGINGVIVKIIDLDNKNTFLKDSKGKEIEVKTDANGLYELKEIPKGNYSIIFKYDTDTYELKESAKIKDYIIESTNEKVAITKTIKLQENKNINVELLEKADFDLKIDKYISKVVVQTANGTKTSTYENKKLAREEINRKYISGAIVLVEYALEISNIGELAGYATEIVDYLPKDMKFHSELNSSWYIGEDKNLYSTSLASTEIKPGETKTIKLVLLKTMNSENVGTTANNAEITNMVNRKEYTDINLSNNQSKAEIIINIATGTIITYMLAILNAIAIIGAGVYIINKKIVRKEQV